MCSNEVMLTFRQTGAHKREELKKDSQTQKERIVLEAQKKSENQQNVMFVQVLLIKIFQDFQVKISDEM